jgi:diacylglycerol kinase
MGRLQKSFSYAIQGIQYSIASEHNMKIHLLASIIAVVIGFIVHLTRLEWGLLSLTIFMVLTAETINTSIERAIDLFSTKQHPLAKIAKDLAAGGVLLTALNAVIIAFILFGPYLIGIVQDL